MMHILLAANYNDRGTAYCAYLALKRFGHKITLIFPEDCGCEDWVKISRGTPIPDFVSTLGQKPDIYMQVEWGASHKWFPAGIAELDMPTAFWALDNHLNFRWQKEYCELFDYAFFTQYDWAEKAKRYGIGNISWLPYAADELFHRDAELERDIEVGYVGSVTGQKMPFFESLRQSGVDLQTNDRYFTHEEAGRFYSRCKIVYNICARFDLNHRTFEAALAGALMVGQGVIDKGFYKIFTPGVDADIHDFDDAPRVIKGYLADVERLRRVAAAGQKLVRDGHTYRHRMGKMLNACSGGVTRRRLDIAHSHLAHLKMALVFGHPHFRMKPEAVREMRLALGKDFAGTIFYLLKYGIWRIKEKIQKTIWEMGKRPV